MGISCRRICRALASLGLLPRTCPPCSSPMSTPTTSAAWPPISRNTAPPSSLPPAPPGSCTTGWQDRPSCCPSPWADGGPVGGAVVTASPTSHDCRGERRLPRRHARRLPGLPHRHRRGPAGDAAGPSGSGPAGAGEQPRRGHAPGRALPLPAEAPGAGRRGPPEQCRRGRFAADSARAGPVRSFWPTSARRTTRPSWRWKPWRQARWRLVDSASAAPRCAPGRGIHVLEGAPCRR